MRKGRFISMVFDNNLYYQNGIYRTPTMMEVLSLKAALMAERGYLIYEKRRDFLKKSRQAERAGLPAAIPK